MRVSVVVPTYRRPELVARCLSALAAQKFDPSAYEIIIADDAASPATQQQVEAFAAGVAPKMHYVPVTGAHGPAAARNAGWRAARGEIIAFTDDDCVPDVGWLAAGAAAFADDAVVAVSGRVVVPLPEIPTDYERDAAGLEGAEFVTANCLCRRTALEAVGGFDERFGAAWREDSDLQFTLLSCGGKIVRAVEALVVHPVRPARWGISLWQQRKVQYDALLSKKHPALYRRRVRPGTPWDYYAIVASLLVACWGGIPAAVAVGVWALLTARFCRRRLCGTSHRSKRIAEMVVTSALIPPLSVFWRLYGAVRFRVPFL